MQSTMSLKKKINLIFTFLLIFIFNINTANSNNFTKGNEFEATISYEEYDLFRVNLSTISGLNWIKTIACVEILIMDDVIIQPWYLDGKVAGGFFYIIDDDKPRNEWDDCQITGFYKNKPN